jgi:hypothetical protein
MGFSRIDSFGAHPVCTHPVWQNGKKYLIILVDPDKPFAFVKLESHIEYMNFARDYFLPLIELQSRSEAFMPEREPSS